MRAARPAHPLPSDIRLMNALSAVLVSVLLLMACAVLLGWVTRLPLFAFQAIQIQGDVTRNSAASLRANALPSLSGTFLSMSLFAGQKAFEAVPWVRSATVQRVWPNRLRVKLEEHRPAAYWETKVEGADEQSDSSMDRSLVNSFGEVFQANLGDVEDDGLPELAGPVGSSAAMLHMWQRLQAASTGWGDRIERLDLSGRGSWRLTFEKGAVVELGRGNEDELLARFGHFIRTITQITSRYKTAVLSADLRHADGYAVRLRGITTTLIPVKSRLNGASKRN